MVQRMRLGSIPSVLLMGGSSVHSILLLPLLARYIETIYVCIWRILVYVCCSDCVGSVGMFVV